MSSIKREQGTSGVSNGGPSTFGDVHPSSAALLAALGASKSSRMTNGDHLGESETKRSQTTGKLTPTKLCRSITND